MQSLCEPLLKTFNEVYMICTMWIILTIVYSNKGLAKLMYNLIKSDLLTCLKFARIILNLSLAFFNTIINLFFKKYSIYQS